MAYFMVAVPIRSDDQGDGEYLAPRGSRKHNGLDGACYKGSLVCAVAQGTVTYIGRPYYYEKPKNDKEKKKNALRYVQVTDATGYSARYFYVTPLVKLDDIVERGDFIGATSGIEHVYNGMMGHFHFEVKLGAKIINPNDYLKMVGHTVGM